MATGGEVCSKIDTCYKIVTILDKDLSFDALYAQVIRSVCAKCEDAEYAQKVKGAEVFRE